MSFQSSRTNVSCVNPAAPGFVLFFLVHPPLVTLGLSKRAYLDTTRNHTDLVFTSGKYQVKTETWSCLMVLSVFYLVCIGNVHFCSKKPLPQKKEHLVKSGLPDAETRGENTEFQSVLL